LPDRATHPIAAGQVICFLRFAPAGTVKNIQQKQKARMLCSDPGLDET
jgi:hypothetical protein